MELIILILAGIVVYYLYISLQDYLKNPLHKKQDDNVQKDYYDFKEDPYNQDLIEEKKGFVQTELGVMLAIAKKMPNKERVKSTFDLTLRYFVKQYFVYNPQVSKDEDEALSFLEEEDGDKSLDSLAKEYLNFSYAEYKKRLKFVEFLLFLVYLDGSLDDQEKEFLLDVASVLQLDNKDFNELYDIFEKRFEGFEALEIQEQESLDLEAMVEEKLVDVFDIKSKNLVESAFDIAKALKSLSATSKQTRTFRTW